MTSQHPTKLASRASVSGHPTMVSWSRGKPRLYLADTDGPIELAGLAVILLMVWTRLISNIDPDAISLA